MIHVTMFVSVFALPEKITVSKNIVKSKHSINLACP